MADQIASTDQSKLIAVRIGGRFVGFALMTVWLGVVLCSWGTLSKAAPLYVLCALALGPFVSILAQARDRYVHVIHVAGRNVLVPLVQVLVTMASGFTLFLISGDEWLVAREVLLLLTCVALFIGTIASCLLLYRNQSSIFEGESEQQAEA